MHFKILWFRTSLYFAMSRRAAASFKICDTLCRIPFINNHGLIFNVNAFRVAEQWWQLGGNAANTATVLSLLGGDVEFLGTMAVAPEQESVLLFSTY